MKLFEQINTELKILEFFSIYFLIFNFKFFSFVFLIIFLYFKFILNIFYVLKLLFLL